MVQSRLTYDPSATYEVQVRDVDYLTSGGQTWPATIYQPQGDGPFPALLDVHGGGWSIGSRSGGKPIHRALAACGLVIAAVDFRLAPDPEGTYPAQVQDVNYATRWLKAHAAEFNADPETVGGMGASAGAHTVMLSAMRPNDPRYAAITSPGTEGFDATLSYVILNWPVMDSDGWYTWAKKEEGAERFIEFCERYFPKEADMKEGSPHLVVERGDHTHLPDSLLVHGMADDVVPMSISERFVDPYRAAGGAIDFETFPGVAHGFAREPGPETERAIQVMKAFIAHQTTVSAAAV